MAKTTPTEPELQDHGLVEVRTKELDGYTIDFVTVKQPVDMSFMLRGLPGDCCHCSHMGVITKGRMTVRYTETGVEETVGAGEWFHMTPGHVPSYEVGTELVQFSPTDDMKATDEALRRNLEALQAT